MSVDNTGAAATPPPAAPPAAAPAATAPADDGKGGKAAVLADLAAERDQRQALETQIQQLKDAQTAQTAALAKAFGIAPDETSDMQTLTAQVTFLQEQFDKTQHENAVLAVANAHHISDEDDLALLRDAKDQAAMQKLAARIAQANDNSSSPSTPKPDRTQGGKGGTTAKTPSEQFADILRGS